MKYDINDGHLTHYQQATKASVQCGQLSTILFQLDPY